MAHSGAWKGLAAELDDLATITAPDMLGHGRSPDWDGQGDFQDRMIEIGEDLATGPVDLIGHSFGGTLALRMAVADPGRVRSLILIEPVLFAVAGADAPDLAEAEYASMRPVFAALEAGDAMLAARLFNRLWGAVDGPRWDDLPEATRAAMARGVRVLPAGGPAIYQDRPGLLRPGVLDRVTCPTLVIRGARSPAVMTATTDGLIRRLPAARGVVIESAGHMVPITHAAAVAAPIRALWGETARAPHAE